MSLQETHQCLLLTINMSRSGVLTARRRRWHRGSSAFSDNLHPDDPGMPRPEPHRVECRLSFFSFNIPSFLFLYSFFFLRGPCVDHNERTGLVASDRLGKRHTRFAEDAFHVVLLPEADWDCALTVELKDRFSTSSVRIALILVQKKNKSKER